MKCVTDDALKRAFVTMMNKLVFGHQTVLRPLLQSLRGMNDKAQLLKMQELEEKIEADAPKVLWAEQCLKSKTNMTVEEFSKVIFQKEDIEMGRNKTFAYLRKTKLLRSTNLPYPRYMDQGWFVVPVNLITAASGTLQNKQTLITPKGQQAMLKNRKDEQKNAATKELPVQEVYVKLQK